MAGPPGNLYRFQKMLRRNKLTFAAAGAVVTALVLGVLVSTWQAVRASRAESAQSRLRQQAEANEQKAQKALASEAQLLRKAEAGELAARQKAYASDMNRVKQALDLKNVGLAEVLLNRHRPQPGQQDLRGWEWRYLWQQCQSDALFTLFKNSKPIGSLAVSHDGRWLAVGEDGGTGNNELSIWDLQTRREIARLPAGDNPVEVAFSPREPLLAFTVVSERRRSVRLWDVATGKIVAALPLWCNQLAFSSDGQSLLTVTAIYRLEHGFEADHQPHSGEFLKEQS